MILEVCEKQIHQREYQTKGSEGDGKAAAREAEVTSALSMITDVLQGMVKNTKEETKKSPHDDKVGEPPPHAVVSKSPNRDF